MSMLDDGFRHKERVLKARKPVDGDGDGWVYDGTPKKRPATPAEMARGARLRAKKAVADPKKKPAARAAKKAAAAKNPIEQRKARFRRAIKAVKGKQDEKRVRDLIRQDFILDTKSRNEMEAELRAHVGGKAPAKKAPAKKVAAKKVAAPKVEAPEAPPAKKAAKKVPAKAAEKRPAKKLPAKKAPGRIREAANKPPEFDVDVHNRGFDLPGPAERYGKRIAEAKDFNDLNKIGKDLQRDRQVAGEDKRKIAAAIAERRAEMMEAARPKAEADHKAKVEQERKGEAIDRLRQEIGNALDAEAIQRVKEKIDAEPLLDDKARKELHQDRRAQARDNMRPGRKKTGTATRNRNEAANYAARLVDQINAAKDEAELEQVKRGIRPKDKELIRQHPDLMNHINDVFKAKKQNLREAKPKTTAHGRTTNAWKRLWNRDLGKAKTRKQLDRLDAQVDSLHKQGRISDNEAAQLREAVERKRQEVGGVRGFTALRRNLAERSRKRTAAPPKAKTPDKPETDFGNLPDTPDAPENGPETEAFELLNNAKNLDDVARAEDIARQAYRQAKINAVRRDGILDEAKRKREELEPDTSARGAQRVDVFDDRIAEAAGMNPRMRNPALKKIIEDLQKEPDINEKDFHALLDQLLEVDKGNQPQRVGRRGTIVPPSQPGAARARAHAAGGVQVPPLVQRRFDKIDNAKNVNDVELVINEVANNQRIPPEYIEAIADRAEAAMKKFDVGDGDAEADGPNGNWNAFGPPWAKPIRAGSPAAKHFENGGGLADAPEDGLFDYLMKQVGVESMAYHLNPGDEGLRGQNANVYGLRPKYEAVEPDKYRVTNLYEKNMGGISANYFVEELNPDGSVKTWRMFKGSNGLQRHDIENEVVANRMLQRMGVAVPNVQFARNPRHNGPKWLAMENAAVILGDKYDPNANIDLRDYGKLGANGKRGLKKYRDQVLLMDMFDWLINNGDRHGGNWMVLGDGEGGYRPVIIDNGGGFQHFGKDTRFSAGRQSSLLRSLYDGNRDALLRDIDRIIEMMERINPEELMNQFHDPDISPKYREHLNGIEEMLNKKLRTLRNLSSANIAREYGV